MISYSTSVRPIVAAVSMVPVVGLVIVGPVVVETHAHTHTHTHTHTHIYIYMYVCISHRDCGIPLNKEAV